ncbi:MAG: flagellar hook-length control protein FliK [Gammaproteobacteria bacterium]|nr:flagellar hook-length control protein FliK [Gammaproteobacteria bacterium]
MEISNTQLQALQQAISLTSSRLRTEGLSVGQQLQARVVAVNPDGQITLHINNTILNARSQLPLSQGQLLQLVVAQLGKKILLIPTQKAIDDAVLAHSIRQTLPLQQPLKDTIQQLLQVMHQNTAKADTLPPSVVSAVRQFMQNLPTSKDVEQAKQLKQVLRNAGTFFERGLAQMANGLKSENIGKDLKAMLMRLRDQLQQSTPGTTSTAKNTSPSATQEGARANNTPPQAGTTQATNPSLTQGRGASTTQQSTATQTPLPQSQTTTGQTGNTNTAQTASQQQQTTQTQHSTATATSKQQTTPQGETQKMPEQRPGIPMPKAATQAARPLLNTALNSQPTTTTSQPLKTPIDASRGDRPELKTDLANAMTKNATVKGESANTLAARSAAQESVVELVRHVENALARTQLHQLNTLNDNEAGKLAWSLEIPIRNDDDDVNVLNMRIFGDAEQKSEYGEIPITVTLEVALKYIGPVFAKITLLKDRVSVGFWAEQKDTVELFTHQLDTLESRLQDSGLTTDNICCHHGPSPSKLQPIPQISGLVDVKA